MIVKEYTKKEPTYKESYKVKFRPQEWQEIVKTLDTLCDIGADDENRASTQLWKPGFYKVAERNEWVTKLYHATLNSILLERVALIIKRELLNNLENREKATQALKAHLLLRNNERRAKMPDYLKQYMLNRWGNLSKEGVKKLNKHFETLLSIKLRAIISDEKAIKRARDSIMTKSGAAGLYYKTLIEVTENMNLNEFQFNQVLASNPQAIRGGEFSIPGIYTKIIILTLMAYTLIHTLRTKLKQKGIHHSWERIRKTLSSLKRSTLILPTPDGIIHQRQNDTAQEQHRIYLDALDIAFPKMTARSKVEI